MDLIFYFYNKIYPFLISEIRKKKSQTLKTDKILSKYSMGTILCKHFFSLVSTIMLTFSFLIYATKH